MQHCFSFFIYLFIFYFILILKCNPIQTNDILLDCRDKIKFPSYSRFTLNSLALL